MTKKTKTRRNDVEFFAAINAGATEGPEPFPSFDFDDAVYVPEIRPTSYAICADILCSAFFGTAKGTARTIVDGVTFHDRAYIQTKFKTTNGAFIEFRGKELRQDDLTVLLQLISLRAGMATECEIEFSPYAFLTQIGWSNNNTSVGHLRECLMRLRQAVVIIERGGNKGEVSGFVSEFSWEGRTHWWVKVDRRMVAILGTVPTYLIIAKRARALASPLQSQPPDGSYHMCRQRPQQRCAGDHRSSSSTETYITTPARAPSAAVSRWRRAQQTEICQRLRSSASQLGGRACQAPSTSLCPMTVGCSCSGSPSHSPRRTCQAAVRNARCRPTMTGTSQSTAKSASEPSTWLQAKNAEHPVQVAIVAGRCELRHLEDFDFSPASLTSRIHESA